MAFKGCLYCTEFYHTPSFTQMLKLNITRMNLSKLLLTLFVLLFFTTQTEAQFLKRLKQRIERKVEDRIVQKVNKEIDKILITEQSKVEPEESKADESDDELANAKVDESLARDIKFQDVTGTEQNLFQYQGKVIYLTFWASWCPPCKQNFKLNQDLREKLLEKGVVLLNVSIDKDADKWASALEQHEYINGHNVHATDLNQVKRLYKIKAIPDYHIINKEGAFVFLSNKKHSQILKDFDEWLAE